MTLSLRNQNGGCFPWLLYSGIGGNNWNNCGNSILQKTKKVADGGDKEGGEGER